MTVAKDNLKMQEKEKKIAELENKILEKKETINNK